jgi:hypothetical protein
MGAERFYVSDTNPNDQLGGGGCVCSEHKHVDCKGPYAIFNHTETDNNLSPHVVLSLECAAAFCAQAEDPDNILAAGEKDHCEPVPDVL